MQIQSSSLRARVSRVLATFVLASASLPSAQAWVSLENKGLTLPSTIATRDAPASQPLHVAVSVRFRDAAGLRTFIQNAHTPGNPQYGQELTTQQFNDRYAPTAAQAQAVADYLTQAGFKNVAIAGNRALITATGTAGIAEKAFNTHIVNFQYQGKAQYLYTSDLQVPDALKDLVLSVAGVTNIQAMHLHHHVSALSYQDPILRSMAISAATAKTAAGPAATHSAGYTGPQFATAYGAGSMPTAYGTKLAIVTLESDLKNVVASLRIAERLNGMPIVPVRIVQVAPVAATNNADAEGEWNLDSQSSTGIAGNVNELVYYNTTDFSSDALVAANNQFAVDNIAKVGNMSYGGCESLNVALGVGGEEQAFAQAAAQGQTWFASTGDAGSTCGVPAAPNTGLPVGIPDVEYPASSPNVVAVGGTTLTTDADYNYVSEASWIGGGSGISNFFAAPSWQVASGAVPSANAATATPVDNPATSLPAGEGGTGRGLPDVAMSGDPASGLITYTGGSTETIGGTSLSSPLAAGAYARLQTAHCNTLGFGAPQFYKLDKTTGLMSTAAGFNDVTSGANGLYVATTGWDYNTGFGSFDITKVGAALPATSCTLNQVPVAKLAADNTAGTGSATVTFDGSGSSDPDGDALVQYALDYGDNSDVAIQTTPVFPPHAYSGVGVYTATLSVRDSAGNASAAATLPITIYGTPQGCMLPGQKMITSPAGVSFGTQGQDIASGQDDLLATYFAEPADMAGKLVVTMKVNNLSGTLTPALRWVTYFNIPENQNNYFVSMDTADGASPTYSYGIRTGTVSAPAVGNPSGFMTLGSLDAASNYKADGTITLVLTKSAIGLKTGDVLSEIISSVRTSVPNDPTGTAPAGEGLTQDTGTASQTFTLVGNDVCAQDIANPPTAPAGGSGSGSGTGGHSGSGSGPGSGNGSSSGSAPAGATTSSSKGRFGGGAFGFGLLPLLLTASRRKRR